MEMVVLGERLKKKGIKKIERELGEERILRECVKL